jgi:hypothetical protein
MGLAHVGCALRTSITFPKQKADDRLPAVRRAHPTFLTLEQSEDNSAD